MTGCWLRSLVIRIAPVSLTAGILAAVFDKHMKLVVILNGMALAGLICGAIREHASRVGRGGDAAELVLQAVLATRTQPADQSLHLVADEGAGSEPPSQAQSVG
jgi:hypothetical protein